MQLRLQATGRFSLRGWSIENRHLLTRGTESSWRYRMRIRAAHSVFPATPSLSIRAFDELFLDVRRGQSQQNTFGAGMGLELGHRGTLELYQVWSRERGGQRSNYLFVVLLLRSES